MIQILKKDLNEVLKIFSKIASKSLKKDLCPVMFEIIDDYLYLSISNSGHLYMKHRVQIKEGSVSSKTLFVPFSVLYSPVKTMASLKGDHLNIIFNDNKMVLKDNESRTKFEINCMDISDIDTMSFENPDIIFDINSSSFLEALNRVFFARSTDGLRVNLSGLKFEVDNNILTIVGVNILYLSSTNVEIDLVKECSPFFSIQDPMFIDILISVLNKNPDTSVSVFISGSKVVVDILGGVTITSTTMDVEFPNYKSIIPKPNSTIVVDKESLVNVLKVLSSTSDKKTDGGSTQGIEVNLKDKNLKFFKITSDYNSESMVGISSMDCSEDACDFKIGVNLQYLLNIVSYVCKSDKVSLGLKGSKSSFIIKDMGNNTSSFAVLAPIRLD